MSEKEKGDKEYKDSYYTWRDGDPATRLFDSFFGYTKSDSTHGKGAKAGREDRYKYGSRDNNDKTHTNSKPKRKSASRSHYVYSGSSSSGGLISTRLFGYGWVTILLTIIYLAATAIFMKSGLNFPYGAGPEKFGLIWSILITAFFLPGMVMWLIILIPIMLLMALFGF